MSEQRTLRSDDYIAFLRRRWWIILLPAVVGAAIGYGITRYIEPHYISTTTVLVEQPRVSASLVMPVVTEELNQRLATMKEHILSRSRLQPVVEKFNLYAELDSLDARIDKTRGSVGVTAVQPTFGGYGGGIPGFRISYISADPNEARDVCSEITSMFIAENLRFREQRSQGTTDFLSKQLEESERKLNEQDSKLAEFKLRHIGQLPGSEQANFNMLSTLTAQLEAVTQGMNRAQQDKNYMETMLQQRLAVLDSQAGTSTSASPAALEAQLNAQQAALLDLETRYTPGHPDVAKARRQVEQLRQRLDAALAKERSPQQEKRSQVMEPADVQQLRSQIYQLEHSIKERTLQQERLHRDIATYQARVQLSPMVEEQYKQLTRDYEIALRFYNDLLGKRTHSEMATDLERQQQGEQFRVMDPPNLPEAPFYPDKLKFAGTGLASGMALGFGVALLLDFRARTIHTDLDIEFYLGVPTLAMITELDEEKQHRKHRKKRLFGDWRGNGGNGAAREIEEYRETVGKS